MPQNNSCGSFAFLHWYLDLTMQFSSNPIWTLGALSTVQISYRSSNYQKPILEMPLHTYKLLGQNKTRPLVINLELLPWSNFWVLCSAIYSIGGINWWPEIYTTSRNNSWNREIPCFSFFHIPCQIILRHLME